MRLLRTYLFSRASALAAKHLRVSWLPGRYPFSHGPDGHSAHDAVPACQVRGPNQEERRNVHFPPIGDIIGTCSCPLLARYWAPTHALLRPYSDVRLLALQPSLSWGVVAGPVPPGRTFGAPLEPANATGGHRARLPRTELDGISRQYPDIAPCGAARHGSARDNDAMRQERTSATPAGNGNANRGDFTMAASGHSRQLVVSSVGIHCQEPGSTPSSREVIFAI